jgi:hypothetical protein
MTSLGWRIRSEQVVYIDIDAGYLGKGLDNDIIYFIERTYSEIDIGTTQSS